MRVMILINADERSEAGVLPDEKLLPTWEVQRGAGKCGRADRGRGAASEFEGEANALVGDKRMAIDGPFTEAKELVAGFWLWQVGSMEEAVAWVKRIQRVADDLDSDGIDGRHASARKSGMDRGECPYGARRNAPGGFAPGRACQGLATQSSLDWRSREA
jgi:hypothetical protein